MDFDLRLSPFASRLSLPPFLSFPLTRIPTMLSSDGKHLYVSWDEYHRLIERLALIVFDSGWHFDSVLCLARGGMRVGDVVSRIFDRPLAVLSTSSYRENSGTQQGHLDIARNITMAKGELRGKVLLVDDLSDTGVTLAEVVRHVRRSVPTINELRSAVLWLKGISTYRPDYHVELLPTSPWIHQPFEDYDAMRPMQLKQRLQEAQTATA